MKNNNIIKNNKVLRCTRCVHVWRSRINKTPKFCPKCKSPYWYKERKKISKEKIIFYKNWLINLQREIIDKSGGLKGVRDEGGIYYSLYNLFSNMEKYKGSPIKEGALIYHEFARKHHFVDGNKRISHLFAKSTLLASRGHLTIPYKEAVKFILKISKYNSRVTLEEIEEWLEGNCKIIEKKEIEDYIKINLFDIKHKKERSQIWIK